eukprot:CAMPEP_0178925970 /NCGR_PEP_ID=MMETSP0786-20121207/18238_1 /TAXON_ID=186022 /ORGANISM="Thalassionema frauenfeldii, Strain CCMP 1798" /LENGTH=1471 /DNA_ID=CAMNT_0020600971 /DNA_START=303 /DNA_END=4718 /DNA_ORIENTATION=+
MPSADLKDSVPFRVRLLSSKECRPMVFDKCASEEDLMKEWTGENIIRCRGVPVNYLSEFSSSRIDCNKAINIHKDCDYFLLMYLLAVKLRRVDAIKWLYKEMNSSKSFNVKKLISLGIRVDQTFMAYKYDEEQDSEILNKELSRFLLKLVIHYEQSCMEEDVVVCDRDSGIMELKQEFEEVLQWLKSKHGIDYQDYNDNLDRTPEHVAALRGDFILMHFFLQKGLESTIPLDFYNSSPVMYAASKGHLKILHLYAQKILDSSNEGKWQLENLEYKDENGLSCWDLAKNNRTMNALNAIKNAIEGNITAASLLPLVDFEKNLQSRESNFCKGLLCGSTVEELKAMMKLAKNDASAVGQNTKGFLILGDRSAWQNASLPYQEKWDYLISLIVEDRLEVLEWAQDFFTPDQRKYALDVAITGGHLEALRFLYPIVHLESSLGKSELVRIAVAALQVESATYFLEETSERACVGTELMRLCLKPYDYAKLELSQKSIADPLPQDRLAILKILDQITTEEVDYSCLMAEAINTMRKPPDSKQLMIPESFFDWLLDEKHLDPLEVLDCVEGPSDPALRNGPKWFTNFYNKKLLLKNALELQRYIRGHSTRQKIRKIHPDFGAWSELILKIKNMKTGNLPDYFGKTWAELKIDCNYVAQSNEYEIYEDEALAANADLDQSIQDDELEKNDGIIDYTDDMIGKFSPEAKVLTILLTSEALKWLRMQKDQKYRNLFHKRIDQLAKGGQSYCLSKKLKGSKHGAFETKLDKGQRIIWTQRGTERMIWFICKHDKISRCCELIDLSYDRVLTDGSHEEFEPVSDDKVREPEMLANPIANVPLKIHSVDVDDLDRLLVDENWTPPLKLTPTEEEIVTREGTVLLLGRSGTGKTLCVCNRMARDRLCHKSSIENFRQLFVSRTSRLCEYVEALQKRAGEDLTTVAMRRVDDFVDEMSKLVEPEITWQDRYFVSYERFCSNDVLPQVIGAEKELDALQIWTQIRSFIKGSYEAITLNRPLTKQEYLALSKDRCRLDVKQRCRAYAIFERYQGILDNYGWWDEVGKARHVYVELHKQFNDLMEENVMPLYTHIYVDEIQDITQAEIALLFLVSGNNYRTMFFAGDTAQTVSQGVDFRFEEIRSIVYAISDGKYRLERPEKLTNNFRSHNGILSVSNLVLNRLHAAFPAAASKLKPDKGLVLGPRPGLIMMEYSEISAIINENSRIRILVRDELKETIKSELGPAGDACLGIRDAKGLEFRDVIILDFFGGIPDKVHNKAWKDVLLGDSSKKAKISSSFLDLPVSMELELKLLYTAITRSCDRLFFIETKKSQSFDAWRRCLKKDDLAIEIKSEVIGDKGVMTADDWLIEGIEIASQVSDSEVSEAKRMLLRAIDHFQKAHHKMYEDRCHANLRALEVLDEVVPHISLSADEQGFRKNGSKVVSAYLDAGLVNEATRYLRNNCSALGLEKFLRNEILNLCNGTPANG